MFRAEAVCLWSFWAERSLKVLELPRILVLEGLVALMDGLTSVVREY